MSTSNGEHGVGRLEGGLLTHNRLWWYSFRANVVYAAVACLVASQVLTDSVIGPFLKMLTTRALLKP
jgi:hypothetical protein